MRGAPQHLAWRDSIANGTLVGPTIFTSGPSIRRSRDPVFVLPTTPAEAEALVRAQARAGYDMIKVLNDLSLPVYDRLLATARSLGIPVVGHVVSDIGLSRSLAAGQVSIEHAFNLRERSRFSSLFGGDETQANAQDALAVARAGAWVGTLVSSRDGTCAARPAEQRAIVASLRRANVKLLAGTDAGIGPVSFGPSLHCELSTLVAVGPHALRGARDGNHECRRVRESASQARTTAIRHSHRGCAGGHGAALLGPAQEHRCACETHGRRAARCLAGSVAGTACDHEPLCIPVVPSARRPSAAWDQQ